jgi:hypothetical protein
MLTMDAVLIVITVGAFVIAAGLAVIGWRLLHTDGRGQTAERVEALRALAAEPDGPDQPADPVPVAVLESPAVVPVFARFATLAPEQVAPADWDATLGGHVHEHHAAATSLFARPPVASSVSRRPLLVGAVALVMLASAGTVYAVYRPQPARGGRLAEGRVAAGTVPLDLLSLTESVDTDGTFTVTGLVGNPTTGRPAEHVVAVVYLFDQAGHYFATARAGIDVAALAPGDQSPFVVKVPHGASAVRYRVGFREPDGAVVAHVDRRGQPIDGMTGGETAPPRGSGNE